MTPETNCNAPRVEAQDGSVVLHHPSGGAVPLTPDAAHELSRALLRAAADAGWQRIEKLVPK